LGQNGYTQHLGRQNRTDTPWQSTAKQTGQQFNPEDSSNDEDHPNEPAIEVMIRTKNVWMLGKKQANQYVITAKF
jgi:hypothetical protein